jgi:hypothetical protein
MKYLKKFEEVRISDILKVTGSSESSEKIKKLMNVEFDQSQPLIKEIKLNNTFINRKIVLRIRWNDTTNHSIVKRIRERTNFNSTEEFNEYFEEKIQKIIPEKIGNEINESGRYALYDKEYDFSIIIDINPDDFIRKGIYKIFVFTILPLKRGRDVIKFLDI